MFIRLLFLSICTCAVQAASTGVQEPKLPIPVAVQATLTGVEEPKLPTEQAASTNDEPKFPPIIHTFRRDYTFDAHLGGWLKFNPMPVEWKEAALRCHYEGAILASPVNGALTKALTDIVADRGSAYTIIFTGISNINSRSEYQSFKGLPISNIWLSWLGNPKVKPSEENCVVMNSHGAVSAVRCSDPHPFVCYRQKPFREPNRCDTEDPEYRLNLQTGSCYKISSESLIWSEAFKICATDGGHLAIINSWDEARILWELSRRYARENTVLIGVRAWGVRRAWINVQGQSLEEAGYSDWRRGEPNNANGNEYCVGIHPGDRIDGGVMNDVPCNDRFHFICEIEPKASPYQ